MEKFKFVGFTVLMVIGSYVLMLPLWPIITASAFNSATSINATANAYTYRHTIGALRFAPLVLYFVPGAVGVAAIAWKLKFSKQND